MRVVRAWTSTVASTESTGMSNTEPPLVDAGEYSCPSTTMRS